MVSPVRAAGRLFELGGTAAFWHAVLSTCLRVLEGFGLAIVTGSILAVLTSRFAILKYLFQPFLGVIRATPVASLIILALVWLAVARIPVFVVFLMVMPIVWTNLFAGLDVIDPQLLEMGRVFQFGCWKKLRYIYLPSLMPYIVSALVTGLGAAWKSAIGAEVIARPVGSMGRYVYDSRIHLLMADLFAWTIAVIVLSVLLEKLMVRLLGILSRRLAGTRRAGLEKRHNALSSVGADLVSARSGKLAGQTQGLPLQGATTRVADSHGAGIKFEKVSKSFGDKVVIRDFSLALPPSGVVAFMGASGYGKTTLLRLLSGLEQPDSGRVVAEYERLSMVFQEDRLLGGVTALGNVLAVLDRKDEVFAMEWLVRMGLGDSAHLLPHELSGGMRRRLAIARAMAYGGDVMLLDEPFAGLDDATREQIYPYMFDRRDTSRLTILVTHDRQEAERLADRLIVMEGPVLTVVEDVLVGR